jgi:hypothetical protein
MDTTDCPRCGEGMASQDEFCVTCGLPRDSRLALLPTTASLEAGRRNAVWLDAHPEHRRQVPIATVPPPGTAVRPPDLAAFRNPEWPGRWAEIGLALLALVCAIDVGLDLWHLSVLGRDLSDPANAQAYLDSVDRLHGIAIAVLLAWLTCAVTFIAWMRRSYRNLRAVGAGQRFKPGWAVGGWFVPFLNLWRPKQLVNDIWRGSDPGAPPMLPANAYERAPVPRTITLWWALFLVGNLVAGRLWRAPLDTVADERAFIQRDLAGTAIHIVALILALVVVRSLTRRQQARAQSLAALPAAPA